MPNESRKKLYDAVSAKYDIGTFDEFNKKMDDKVSREKFYSSISKDFDLGDFSTFESKISVKKKEQPISRGFGVGLEPSQPYRPSVLMPGVEPVYGKPTKAKTVAEAQKEAPVTTKTATEMVAPIMADLNRITGGFYKIPRLIYNTAAAVPNAAAELMGRPDLKADYDSISKGTYNPLGIIDRVGNYSLGISEDWVEKQKKYEKSLTDNILSGNFKIAGEQLTDNITGSIPSILSMYLTGGAASAAKMNKVAGTFAKAAPFASTKSVEIQDNPNIPDYLKPLNSWMTGLSEVVYEEAFGTKSIIDNALKVADGKGPQAAVNFLSSVLKPATVKVLNKVQPITNVVANGIEEGVTQISQNIIDKYTGVDPERDIMDGVSDAIIVGSAQGLGATAIGKGIEYIANPERSKKVSELEKARLELINDMDNESVPEDTKIDLDNKLSEINEQINTELEANREEMAAVPVELTQQANRLQDEIDSKESSITSVELSEQSKSIINEDITNLKKDLDKVNKKINDAIQKQTTSQVPVQPKARVGEEVAKGKPQAKPQEVAQVKEEVSFSKDEKLNKFLNQLNTKGNLQKNPINRSELIFDDKASLEINRFDKGDKNEIVLQDMMVADKGKGEGTRVLKNITDSADDLGYKITLEAKPFGNDPKSLDIENLVKFYKKGGFEVDLSAYGGEFNTEQELIDYAKQYTGESVPMFRNPKVKEAQVVDEDYKKEVEAYKWYVVDLSKKEAVTGYEFRDDAKEALGDYDGDPNFKLVSKKSLSKFGVEDPTNKFIYGDKTKQKEYESLQEAKTKPSRLDAGQEEVLPKQKPAEERVRNADKRAEVKKSLEELRDSGLLVSAVSGKKAMTDAEIDAQMKLMDAMSNVWKETTGQDNFYESFISDIKKGDIDAIKQKGGILFQDTEVPQAPLSRVTLAVFELPEFKKMEGTMVAPQSISDLMKSRGKQIEKDIISTVLGYDKYKGQKRISYDAFRSDVEVQVMKLEPIKTNSYATYGMDNLGDEHNYGNAETIIYNSPVDHGFYGHFSTDFMGAGLANRRWEMRQIPGTEQYVAIDADIPAGLNENEIAQYVGTAGSLNDVSNWIALRDRNSNEEINRGMFGHIRGWFNKDAEAYYLAELQSDYFQKHKATDLYASLVDTEEVDKYVYDKFILPEQKKLIKFAESYFGITVKKLAPNPTDPKSIRYGAFDKDGDYILMSSSDYFDHLGPLFKDDIEDIVKFEVAYNAMRSYKDNLDTKLFRLQLGESPDKLQKDYEDKLLGPTSMEDVSAELAVLKVELDDYRNKFNYARSEEANKYKQSKIEEIKNSQKGNLILRQFVSSQKVHEARLFREALKRAADLGANRFLIPTPYTLAVIEGYTSKEGNAPYEVLEANDERDLSEGDVIEYADQRMTIVESDRSTFRAAPSDRVSFYNINDFVVDQADGILSELRYDLKNQVQDIDNITREEVRDYDPNKEWMGDVVLDKMQDYINKNNLGYSDTFSWDDIEDKVYEVAYDYYSSMSVSELFDWAGDVYQYDDIVYVVESRGIIEDFNQPDEYGISNSEDFENELSDAQQTVVNKYKELESSFRKSRPDAKDVVDYNGMIWVETEITDADRSNPIIAFQNEGGKIKGAIDFSNDNKASIYIFDGADISTLAHEATGHLGRRFLEQLSKVDDKFAKDYETAKEWAGVKDDQWSTLSEEKFARAFERYLVEGKAPVKSLKSVFKKLSKWLTNIYKTIKGSSIDIELTPQITGVFDRLLGAKEVAPEVKPEVSDLASKIRSLKISVDKAKLQTNIAGLPVALYNSVIEFVATSVEAGESIASAIDKAIKKYKLDKIESFREKELRKSILGVSGDEESVSIVNEEVARKRADYGFEERVYPETRSFGKVEQEAKEAIRSGKSVYDVIEKARSGAMLSDVEQAMLALFQAQKEAEIVSINEKLENMGDASVLEFTNEQSKKDAAMVDLLAAYDASEVSGTAIARALNIRKLRVLQDYSLAGIIARKRIAKNNQPLTRSEISAAEKIYAKIKKAQEALNAKMKKLNEEQSKLKLQKTLPILVEETRLEQRKQKREVTKEEIKRERDSIKSEIAKILKSSRSELGANKIPVELIPALAKLAKNYIKEGIVNIDELVDKVHADVSEFISDLSKADVKRALSNYDKENRPTKEQLQNKVRKLRNAEEKIKESEDLSGKAKKARKEGKTEDAEDYEKLSDELISQVDDIASEEGIEVEDKRLAAYKDRIRKRINELKTRIEKRDFSKVERDEIKLDAEATKLKKELDKIKFDYEVELAKEELANRNQLQKIRDAAIDVAGVPRAIMATADYSAPFRQAAVATVAYPKVAKEAAKEMFKQAISPELADQWLADLYASPGYQLMKDSGLYIADLKNPKLTAKEEDYTTNLATKIPGLGELVKESERAYVAYLNKMRVDIFSIGVEIMQNNGKSFATHPKEFKSLAKYVNDITGRGDLGKWLSGSAPTLNVAFFSPRLIISRLRLLTHWMNPIWYIKTPIEVKKMYAKDMGVFLAFGSAVLLAFSLGGADVEDDPRSSDFGKIRYGDTRWDIWAGFQQPIRAIAQAATGQTKSTATGKIKELKPSERFNPLSRFFRSKLAPVPALIVDAYTGADMMGVPFDLQESLTEMSSPLVLQGAVESMNQDGFFFGIGATYLPSLIGVGVQTYSTNDFLKQGPDKEIITLLKDKKALAIQPYDIDRKVYDIETGEDRKMTDAEFKIYYQTWANHIKTTLTDNMGEYKRMSPEKFEDEFNKIKNQATTIAKQTVTGVTTSMKTIRVSIDGELETYELTPEEVKIRKSLNEEFILRNQRVFDREYNLQIREGKSPYEAEVEANKELTKKANEYSKKIILKMHKSGNKYDFEQ